VINHVSGCNKYCHVTYECAYILHAQYTYNYRSIATSPYTI